VVWFDYPKNLNPLKNDFNRDLAPLINSKVTTFGNDFTGFAFEIEPVDTALFEWGNNQYEVYPKVVFTGANSTMTQAEFNSSFNILVLQIEADIVDFLSANGGSNVSTHLHFSWGSSFLIIKEW